MLTPREIPKSSALMMRRVGLGVDPTHTISADADQIHHHPRPVPRKRDRARLVAVVKVHRHLLDLQAVQPRDEETFEVEAETAQRLTCEDYLRRTGGKSFESGLGVQNARQKDRLCQPVEEPAHQVTSVEIVKEGGTHHVA